MHVPKIILGIWILTFCLAINGCTLFPSSNKSRPAPIRPKVTIPSKVKSPTVRPAPTKKIPGASSLTEKQITDRLTKIDQAIKKDDWSLANRETNTLGLDMTKFRPTGPKGKTLRETANFNVMYLKLQADVKTKNKTACLKDVKTIQDAMKNVKTSKS